MADIALQIDIEASPDNVFEALTTTDGVARWWTTKNETGQRVGQVNRYWFPGVPMSWDMRLDELTRNTVVAWTCVGGPGPWIGTTVRWSLQAYPEKGTLLLLDHNGFAAVDAHYRTVTMGWAQMVLRLKQALETGEPFPYFTF